ncbi:MAG: hypothetical protein U1F25_10155 [Rubrivivax sp.]
MSRAEAGLPEEGFVLCAFNHTYKIGPEAFDAWCAVMREVPGSVLWLKETNGRLHDNVRREAEARGVAGERIVFAKAVSTPSTSAAWRWPTCSSTPGRTTRTPPRPTRCGPACRW